MYKSNLSKVFDENCRKYFQKQLFCQRKKYATMAVKGLKFYNELFVINNLIQYKTNYLTTELSISKIFEYRHELQDTCTEKVNIYIYKFIISN